MPRPRNERQALEEERAELPALIAHYRRADGDAGRGQDAARDVGLADPVGSEAAGGGGGAAGRDAGRGVEPPQPDGLVTFVPVLGGAR